MYSLASPRFKPLISQTGTILAPNYYTVDVPPDIKESYVPFLCDTKRKDIANQKYTDAIYDVRDQRKIPGGSSMNNKAPRVTFDTGDLSDDDSDKTNPKKKLHKHRTPGPAYYDPTHLRKSQQQKTSEQRRVRRLYVCKVPFSSAAKGPSVPSKLDENGYSLDEDDNLIKNLPDVGDMTIGPAYYCVDEGKNGAKQLYGGCKWSHQTAPRRTITVLNDYPGPGSYDLNATRYDPCAEVAAQTREMAAALSYQPRMMDSLQSDALRDDFPGPLEYNLQKPLVPRFRNVYSAFNNSGERFKTIKDESPGPADYDVMASTQRKKTGTGCGFGSGATSIGKKNKHIEKAASAPVHYLDIFQHKRSRLAYNTAPFDTSAPRWRPLPDLPGPADYVGKPHEEEVKPMSIFLSKAPRLGSVRPRYKTATCATYNVADDFNRLMGKRNFAQKQVGFFSTAKRVAFKVVESADVYAGDVQDTHKKGFYFTVKPRFDDDDNGVPGPGAYLTQHGPTSAMWGASKTYNVRLKENVIGSKLRLAPKQTRDAWLREKSKRKILKVFNRPEIQFMESWMGL